MKKKDIGQSDEAAKESEDRFIHRSLRLRELIDSACSGNKAEGARRIGKDPTYIARLLLMPGAKERRRITGDMAELIENAFHLTRGWIDLPLGTSPDKSTSDNPRQLLAQILLLVREKIENINVILRPAARSAIDGFLEGKSNADELADTLEALAHTSESMRSRPSLPLACTNYFAGGEPPPHPAANLTPSGRSHDESESKSHNE